MRPTTVAEGSERLPGLRFCMVTTFYPPCNFGGDGIAIQRLSEALAGRGHHVTVIHDVDAYNVLRQGNDPRKEGDADGVEVVHLRSGVGGLSPLLTQQTGRPLVSGRKIRRILANGEFDVINFHNISLVGGPGILSAGDAIKLYMAHEHWLVCPSHVLFRHQREACTGRQCLRCVLSHGRPPQLWRYTGYLERQLRCVDAFIAMSEFSREKHREFGFLRPMEVVNYFLPDSLRQERTSNEGSPHENPYFLFVGRLERIKGLDDVIPIFRNYSKADLLVAGDGTHASHLRAAAADIPRVRFLGLLNPNQLDRYYRHAVALIVPTVGFETFGITLIEAFRQSTPVIARRIGPLPEIIERCRGGQLFGGPDELVDAMHKIQDDPALRASMGKSAYEGFRTHWSETAVLPRYLDVVRRAAEGKGRSDIVDALADTR